VEPVAGDGQFADTDDGDEYRALVKSSLKFVDPASARSWEKAGHVPRSAIAELGRHGVFRERWRNGAEEGLGHLLILSEETVQASSGLALAVIGHSEIFTGALHRFAATPWQRELTEQALDGLAVGCFAATESQGGSDWGGLRATAARLPGGWRLRGQKRYISNIGSATHAIVLGRMRDGSGARDLSIFILPLDIDGVHIDGFFGTAGLHACDVGEFSFDVELPPDSLLGKAGLGLLYATYLLQFERVAICAQLTSTARTALDLAVAFSRRRIIGGARLMDKQIVRHRLAYCQAELWNIESRLRELTGQASRSGVPGHELAALKLIASRVCEHVIDESMQTLGARGYTENFPLARMRRDSRLARIGGGSDEVMTELIASALDRRDDHRDRMLDEYEASDVAVAEHTDAGR
jgi:alkylation response protein AidB-like acyl-CoA dehydrogenase